MRQVVPRVIPGRRSEAEAERGASRRALSCAPQHEGPLILRSERGSRPGLILRASVSKDRVLSPRPLADGFAWNDAGWFCAKQPGLSRTRNPGWILSNSRLVPMPILVLPFPAIDPVAISIGPFAVRWYALGYLVGF